MAQRQIRNVMPPVVLALLVLASAATALAQPVATFAAPADWLVYRDEANGITFHYPPNLKVAVPSLETPNASGLLSIVQLWPADGSRDGFAALAILIKVCGDPMVACWDEAQRRSCHSFEAFALGNARAYQCVDFGRAACHWSAQVDRKGRQVMIQAPAAAYEINGRTHGREECAKGMTKIRTLAPIDGILASFVFDKKRGCSVVSQASAAAHPTIAHPFQGKTITLPSRPVAQ